MRKKENRILRFYYSMKICACLGMAALAAGSGMAGEPVRLYAEDYKDLFYVGTADGKVNVRVKPGQDNEQVMYNGEKVQLKAGDQVTIIGEEMVGDKVWFKIRFLKGEDEIVGYCTSSYMTKTDQTITPSPTPTPTEEPTPTPTEELTPTPTEELTPTPTEELTPSPTEDSQKGQKGKINSGIVAAVLVVIVAGAGLIFLKSKQAQAAGKAASRRMAQLKKAQVSEEKEEYGRRKPEIKTKPNSREAQPEQTYQDVYVSGQETKSEEYAYVSRQEDAGAVKKSAAKENEERKALREEIENLREHDLVVHKYFGKGEVYDNSDVRLIEVRFGADVRFMNKDALAAKKLMKRCDDDVSRYYRRGPERQGQSDYMDF